ncbi:MAG: hypothetical protein JOZ62_20360 [Acidobacteriaceae bacterium]|nr:hypothetical protein [Acidobacteriaceae bacterium]
MNQFLQNTFIAAERVDTIEVGQTLAADTTEVELIQGIVIREGSTASSAEEFSAKRLGNGKAGWTNGDARKITQRALADSAIVRKDDIEQPF